MLQTILCDNGITVIKRVVHKKEVALSAYLNLSSFLQL
jgi:hypothetical protein